MISPLSFFIFSVSVFLIVAPATQHKTTCVNVIFNTIKTMYEIEKMGSDISKLGESRDFKKG